MLGGWLDHMLVEVFSNLGDSMNQKSLQICFLLRSTGSFLLPYLFFYEH